MVIYSCVKVTLFLQESSPGVSLVFIQKNTVIYTGGFRMIQTIDISNYYSELFECCLHFFNFIAFHCDFFCTVGTVNDIHKYVVSVQEISML